MTFFRRLLRCRYCWGRKVCYEIEICSGWPPSLIYFMRLRPYERDVMFLVINEKKKKNFLVRIQRMETNFHVHTISF